MCVYLCLSVYVYIYFKPIPRQKLTITAQATVAKELKWTVFYLSVWSRGKKLLFQKCVVSNAALETGFVWEDVCRCVCVLHVDCISWIPHLPVIWICPWSVRSAMQLTGALVACHALYVGPSPCGTFSEWRSLCGTMWEHYEGDFSMRGLFHAWPSLCQGLLCRGLALYGHCM